MIDIIFADIFLSMKRLLDSKGMTKIEVICMIYQMTQVMTHDCMYISS